MGQSSTSVKSTGPPIAVADSSLPLTQQTSSRRETRSACKCDQNPTPPMPRTCGRLVSLRNLQLRHNGSTPSIDLTASNSDAGSTPSRASTRTRVPLPDMPPQPLDAFEAVNLEAAYDLTLFLEFFEPPLVSPQHRLPTSPVVNQLHSDSPQT